MPCQNDTKSIPPATGLPRKILSGQPFIGLCGEVDEKVIDANGHMNVLGFDMLFDEAETALFLALGLGGPNIERTGKSLFRLEKVVRYEKELFLGDPVEVRSLVLGSDGKRIHHFHELWDLERNRRSALFDGLSIHVDLTDRRTVSIDDPVIQSSIADCIAIHATLPRPRGALDRLPAHRAGERSSRPGSD